MNRIYRANGYYYIEFSIADPQINQLVTDFKEKFSYHKPKRIIRADRIHPTWRLDIQPDITDQLRAFGAQYNFSMDMEIHPANHIVSHPNRKDE